MDPISDMLIRIKNASRARLKSVVIPHSELKFQIASILAKGGYIEDVQRRTKKVGKRVMKNIEINVVYVNGEPKLHEVRRVSKLSRRVFTKKSELYPVKSGYGMSIVTTSKGVMTDTEARKAGVGGEVIAEVW
jgi:small subunit ribosomal protein S8